VERAEADPGESILAREDAHGNEAELIRARLARLAEEKDTLAALESNVPTSLEESQRQGRVNEHSPAREKIALFRSLFRCPRAVSGTSSRCPCRADPEEQGNSRFLDHGFTPHGCQWRFLSSLRRMTATETEAIRLLTLTVARLSEATTSSGTDCKTEPPAVWLGPPL